MAEGHGDLIVLLVHGFNVEDPERTIGGLGKHLRDRGHEVHKFCYGHAGFMDVRFANENIAHALVSQVRSMRRLAGGVEVVPVGHSNGCALIQRAAALQEEPLFTRVVYLSPALNNKAELPPLVTKCTVMHNTGDRVVSLGSLIPFHSWGNMGRVGYRGIDVRYDNVDCSGDVSGHSDWFKPEKLGYTVGKVDEVLSVLK